MRPEDLDELKDRTFLSEEQHRYLHAIFSRRLVSVYYELRIILYLGIMLFTTGAGILVYMNIGDVGHVVAIIILTALMILCLRYAFNFARPYDHEKVQPATPYYDYIVLLGCLLFISILGYLQFQYNIFDEGMGATTLVTATFFFYAAYRFDHLGILSLGITALASFWSITVSPQKWYSGNFFDEANLHNTAIFFGAGLAAVGMVLDYRGIKKHFTFTFLNFASLTFLTGCITGMFISYSWLIAIYFIPLIIGCALLMWYAHRRKSFLFLLYAFIAGYTGITYTLIQLDLFDEVFWFMYLMFSCGGFVYFIIRYKSYFNRGE